MSDKIDTQRQKYCEDSVQIVGEDENLDEEVRACLAALPSYNSNKSSSPSSCSFYSSCTLPGLDSEIDSMSTSSFYSTGTLRDTDTDTASYCSVDTMKGDDTDGEEETEEVDTSRIIHLGDSFRQQGGLENICHSLQGLPDLPRDDHPDSNNHEVEDNTNCDRPEATYSRPSYLAGSTVSVNTGSSDSLVSDGEVSFAGQVNDRLGQLLGYVGGGSHSVDVEAAIANIMGYEIVGTEKDKFTVYKICVSCPSSVFGTWFIQRRYSDFFGLRKTLITEHPSRFAHLPFPPKRWVGSNLEPTFLGRRLAGLQVFLALVLETKDLKSSQALLSFLCLNKPPMGQNCLEENRAFCDTLEEAIKELREQLRKKEQLEMELEYHKTMNTEKEQQIQNLFKENQMLRQQKELLMNTLSSGRKTSSVYEEDLKPERVDTLEDFTAKFNLKSGEDPLTSPSSSKSRQGVEEE